VDKLKQSLDDAMNSHKKAMDDNEKLLIDLKKANNQVRVSNKSATIRLMSQCKWIFGDIFVTFSSIKLKLTNHLKVLDELWSEISFKSDNG